MQQSADTIEETTNETSSNAKSGRPRSESSRRAILDATRRLLTHTSVQKLSIEAIARKAGVGKTTIYRWWPNKASVVMEAIFSQPAFQNILPTPSNAKEGIRIQIEKLARQLAGKNGRIVAEIIGEAQPDPKAIEMLVKSFLQDRYNALSSYIEGGKKTGEFDPDMDTDTAIDVVLGPIIFRIISGQEIDEGFTEQAINMLTKSLSV